MFAATSRVKERRHRGDASVSRPGPVVPLAAAVLSVTAAAVLAASLAVIGAPLWLSACVGALGGLRVAAWCAGRAGASGTHRA